MTRCLPATFLAVVVDAMSKSYLFFSKPGIKKTSLVYIRTLVLLVSRFFVL